MSKRAKYLGPYEEVLVFDSEAGVNSPPVDTVVRNGLLSADAPARIRDELLARDDWSEVNQAAPKPAASEKDDD